MSAKSEWDNLGWDHLAPEWDKRMGKSGDIIQQTLVMPTVKNLLKKHRKNAGYVLDLGCGNGYFSRKIASWGYDVTGVDKSEKMLTYAKKYNEELAINYLSLNYMLDEAPLSWHSYFDIIFANNILPHTYHLKAFIDRLSHWLNHDGIVIVVMRHPCFYPKGKHLGWQIKGRSTREGTSLSNFLQTGELVNFAIDDYYNVTKTGDDGQMFTSPIYRKLDDYIGTILNSGFQLIDFLEATPPKDMSTDFPLLYDALNRVPLYLYMVLKKQSF